MAQAPEHVIENKRPRAAQGGAQGKKRAPQGAAARRASCSGTEETFEQLIARPPETLESRFGVDPRHGADLLQRDAERDDPDRAQLRLAARADRALATRATARKKRSCSARGGARPLALPRRHRRDGQRDARTQLPLGGASTRTCSATSRCTRRSRCTWSRRSRGSTPTRPTTRSTCSRSSSRSSRTRGGPLPAAGQRQGRADGAAQGRGRALRGADGASSRR